MEKKLMIIDGNSILNRAFYALPILTNKNNEYTNAVYGFMNIFLKLYDEEKPDYISVAFDVHAKTFRHLKFDEYKGTRKGMPEELRPQVPLLKKLLQKMNVQIFELEGYEADDIIGTLASKAEDVNINCVIISGDRDMLQLCSKTTLVRIPKTKGGKTDIENYYEADIINSMGITPKEFIDVKALMGDTSDNIPGIPGIGEKTALKIIQEFHSLENAIANIENVKPPRAAKNLIEFKDQGIMSKELATILLDAPIQFNLEDSKTTNLFNSEAYDEIKRLEFKSLYVRFLNPPEQLSLQSVEKLQKYNIISNKDLAINFIAELIKQQNTSFVIISSNNELKGISFTYGECESTFLEVSEQLASADIIEVCAKYFCSPVKKITLDSKKEMVFLYKHNITVNNIVFDSMLGAYVLNSSKGSYNYDDIAYDFLDETYPNEEEIFGKGKSKKKYEELQKDILYNFAVNQSNVIFRAYPIMLEKLLENNQNALYFDIELPLAEVLMEMEVTGIKTNRSALFELGQTLQKQLKILTAEIYELAGEEFNINSPSQMGEILFVKLGLKGSKKTKTGFSTAAEILEKLKNEHPVISKILSYRTLTKLNSTYVEGLLNVIDDKTEKIYSTFNQAITSTGRISSTEPNLQNIPIRLEIGKELRKIFVPSNENYVFLDGDYSQIELRILAHVAGDDTLINAFIEGQDIHRLTASQVFNVPFEEVSDMQRSNAKAVNFGIVYGISGFSLSEDLNITKREADRYIKEYFEKYPKIKKYLDESINNAKKDGYASTIFNRRRQIQELQSSNFNERSFGERAAMNMPIQGSAADIIKIAMVKVYKRLKNENLKSKIILQVHDELLLEVCKDEIDIVKKVLKEEMEGAAKLLVPLSTDIHQGSSWYSAK